MAVAALRHKGEMGGIDSVERLDQAIKIIGLCDIRIEQIENSCDIEMKRLKAEAIAAAAEVEAERTQLLALCETFVASARDRVLNGQKSATFNFGVAGYRKSSAKLDLPEKNSPEMEALCNRLEELKAAGQTAFAEVSVRQTRFLLKGDLGKLNDESLKLLDVKRAPGKDTFFVQPDRVKLKEAGDV